jgi:hypothetical protein
MILRIFDQSIPLRKIAFFFLESLFIGGMVFLRAYLRFLGAPASFYNYEYLPLFTPAAESHGLWPWMNAPTFGRDVAPLGR